MTLQMASWFATASAAEPGALAVRCEKHIGPFDVPLSLDTLAEDLGCPVVFDEVAA